MNEDEGIKIVLNGTVETVKRDMTFEELTEKRSRTCSEPNTSSGRSTTEIRQIRGPGDTSSNLGKD